MAGQIALVGTRAEVALHVAAIAARIGLDVVPVDPTEAHPAATASTDERPPLSTSTVLVDVECGHPLSTPGSVAPHPGDAGGGRGAGLAGAMGPAVAGRSPVVVHLAGEQERARRLADRLEAAEVVELPSGADWLADRLGGPPGGRVLAVLGATGGAGASTVAIACALASGDSLLVDTDPLSTGLDLPLGLPEGSGARWAAVPDTEEALVADSLRAALPGIHGIAVVTGPRPDGSARRVAAVLGVGRRDFAATVLDCGRRADVAGLVAEDPAVVVVPGTLAGVVGARRLLADLRGRPVLLAVRPSAWFGAREVAEETGATAFLEVPRWRRVPELSDCGDLLAGRSGRALRRLGQRVWAELA